MGLLFVLSAPSGAGKTSLARALLEADPGLRLSISATTRTPRTGEVHGEDYFFLSPEAFDADVRAGAFLEHARVFGNHYGTRRADVLAMLDAGLHVVFDIDWQGAVQLRNSALGGQVVSVFVQPPSVAILEQRLLARGDAPASVADRMASAQAEMAHAHEYDHVLVNDVFHDTLERLQTIVRSASS